MRSTFTVSARICDGMISTALRVKLDWSYNT